ncbi:MAG: hypothetical protein DCC75_00995 [Proteobacteria bacterium]|nr:MAG: hypothetical protein DCC75_00995 [Pseudomonadota bacterium]
MPEAKNPRRENRVTELQGQNFGIGWRPEYLSTAGEIVAPVVLVGVLRFAQDDIERIVILSEAKDPDQYH